MINMNHEKYYRLSRYIRIVLIGAAFIATIIACTMACAHVDLIDFRSHEMENLEREAKREQDKKDFHSGDPVKRLEAYERNENEHYESRWERNCD